MIQLKEVSSLSKEKVVHSNSVQTIKNLLQLPKTLDQALKSHLEEIGSNNLNTQVVLNINGDLKTFLIPFSISSIVETGPTRLAEWSIYRKSLADDGSYLKPKYFEGIKFDSQKILMISEQKEALKKFDYFLLTRINNAISTKPLLYDIKVLIEGYVDLIIENLDSKNPRSFSLTINGLD